MTDANLYLGRIVPQRFPFPLDLVSVERQLDALAKEIESLSGKTMSLVELADGFVRIANANMAKALRCISVAKGRDPAGHLLVPFGGAAGQHACVLGIGIGDTLRFSSIPMPVCSVHSARAWLTMPASVPRRSIAG